jgi:hypothetical protein
MGAGFTVSAGESGAHLGHEGKLSRPRILGAGFMRRSVITMGSLTESTRQVSPYSRITMVKSYCRRVDGLGVPSERSLQGSPHLNEAGRWVIAVAVTSNSVQTTGTSFFMTVVVAMYKSPSYSGSCRAGTKDRRQGAE